jgi:hypothetical protein
LERERLAFEMRKFEAVERRRKDEMKNERKEAERGKAR